MDLQNKQKATKCFTKWGRDRELAFFTSVPGSECTSPRDGEKLQKSADSMFLAVLLNRSRTAKQIIEALDHAGTWHYFPGVAGTESSLNARGMRITMRLNSSTIRKLFKESFLLFRSHVSSREMACHDLFIEQKSVREFESRVDATLWKFGSKLIRPSHEKEDPLVDRLHEVSLFEWISPCSTQAPSLKHGEVYCPLDGPVIPIGAIERTPAFSWKILCGTEWRLYLCPECLGVFDSYISKRN